MYNIFDIQKLIQKFKYMDQWGIPEQHYAMTILSLLETDKPICDIKFYDIEKHYYDEIFGKY